MNTPTYTQIEVNWNDTYQPEQRLSRASVISSETSGALSLLAKAPLNKWVAITYKSPELARAGARYASSYGDTIKSKSYGWRFHTKQDKDNMSILHVCKVAATPEPTPAK